MKTLTFETHSLTETQLFGARLAMALQAGDVVALVGNLGAGKTHLAQAIAGGLGVDPEIVTSPTFVLIQEYEGTLPIFHMDAYRLNDTDEFLELGADELLGADNICLIEWADRVADVLPEKQIRIEIESISETSRRILVCIPQTRIQEFQQKLSGSRESKTVDG